LSVMICFLDGMYGGGALGSPGRGDFESIMINYL
jgi:hypothetical protein